MPSSSVVREFNKNRSAKRHIPADLTNLIYFLLEASTLFYLQTIQIKFNGNCKLICKSDGIWMSLFYCSSEVVPGSLWRGADRPPTPLTGPDISPRFFFLK